LPENIARDLKGNEAKRSEKIGSFEECGVRFWFKAKRKQNSFCFKAKERDLFACFAMNQNSRF
jgi:hypothetical protein